MVAEPAPTLGEHPARGRAHLAEPSLGWVDRNFDPEGQMSDAIEDALQAAADSAHDPHGVEEYRFAGCRSEGPVEMGPSVIVRRPRMVLARALS